MIDGSYTRPRLSPEDLQTATTRLRSTVPIQTDPYKTVRPLPDTSTLQAGGTPSAPPPPQDFVDPMPRFGPDGRLLVPTGGFQSPMPILGPTDMRWVEYPSGPSVPPQRTLDPLDMTRIGDMRAAGAQLTPPASTVPGVEDTAELRSLSDAELNSLLDAIAARYNLSREQLLAQESQLGLAARQLDQQLAVLRRDSLRSAENASSERGLLRSGLHARNVAAIDQAVAEQAIAGAMQRQLTQQEIAAARAAIEGNQATDQATARQASAQGLLSFEQGQTVADLLATLPLAPNNLPAPIMPGAPIVTPPLLPSAPSLGSLFGSTLPPEWAQTYYQYLTNPQGSSNGGAGGGTGGARVI